MFALRGLAVSLSVFVVLYSAVSFLVSFTWERVRSLIMLRPMRRVADVLYALRMVPLATAVTITAAFIVPSFLMLEPRAIEEPLGGFPLILGLCGTVVILLGTANVAVAIRRALHTISDWISGAESVQTVAALPVLRISPAAPRMTAVGILRPKILVSGSAEFLLDERELQTALNHEIAHVRRRDNLKKLMLRLVAFPGMRRLEDAWLDATEMAADDAAVSSAGEALDLAAALIKLSYLAPAEHPPELAMSLLRNPASTINDRVERLIHWTQETGPKPKFTFWYALGATLVAGLAVTYGHLLVQVHTATEWLVR